MASTPSSDCATHNTPDVSDNELEDDSSAPVVPVSKPKTTSNAKKATSVDCWSMKLDAFILNQHVFNQDHFIAPLNRPDNSAFLSGAFSAPDVIPFVDIDGAYPWYRNSRITDVTKTPEKKNDYSGMLRTDRLGVYLHWCLPQHFRTGATKDTEDGKAGEVKVSERVTFDSNARVKKKRQFVALSSAFTTKKLFMLTLRKEHTRTGSLDSIPLHHRSFGRRSSRINAVHCGEQSHSSFWRPHRSLGE